MSAEDLSGDLSGLRLLAERLRLGVPLRGFDGREIPLQYPSGVGLGPVEGAILLLLSATRGLHDAHAQTFFASALAHVESVERSALDSGDADSEVVEKVVAALVRAAIRADLISTGRDADAPTIEQASRSWYGMQGLRRHALMMRPRFGPDDRHVA